MANHHFKNPMKGKNNRLVKFDTIGCRAVKFMKEGEELPENAMDQEEDSVDVEPGDVVLVRGTDAENKKREIIAQYPQEEEPDEDGSVLNRIEVISNWQDIKKIHKFHF